MLIFKQVITNNNHMGTNKVLEIRGDKRWSAEQLARIARLSRSTISRIENDQVDPTRTQMIKIARAFKMPVYEVFDLENI